MQDLIGRTIGHYRVVEHLGGGGMGVVYRAEDTKLGREVALKFLPPEWSRDPAARERFLREARAASALEDSRICTIHDIDETGDGQLFIAMAFYEGETLKKKLERGRLPIGTAIDIAIQVAEGLERAHSADILHRDIKPANLMLTQRDEVVIVDFGLAKLAGELSLTESGSSLGTPHYMSPEQASGGRVDARTDLWSLGVVLYEMLAGQRPFGGENNAAVARAILDDEPPKLTALRPEAPPELGGIVARALEKDASKRYQRAGGFLGDLKELRNQLSDREGVTEAAPSRVPTRRRLYLAPVLAAAVLFVVTTAVIWVLRSGVIEEPVETAPPRIVVLPFENLGPPEDEYFADGMTEEIISRLSAVSGLHVISRTSAVQYKGTDKAIGQIGEELNVQYVLEGTVRWERAGEGRGRVRITPQLIEVEDDRHVWSDRYDRAIESVFEVQSDIAQQVVAQLHVTLLEREEGALEAKPTNNPEAYEAFLRGQKYCRAFGFSQNKVAVTMFLRAVELDPQFVVAWAMLSDQHSRIYHLGYEGATKRCDAAKQAVEKALELDPDLPEVRLALAFYYYRCDHDYERALDEFSRALKINPNDTIALRGRAWVLRRQGRWEEAANELERVLGLSPRDSFASSQLSDIYIYLRDFRRAEECADLTISLAPDVVHSYVTKWERFYVQGRWRDARGVFDEVPPGLQMRIRQFNQEFAERRFEEALATLNAIPEADFEKRMGERGAGIRAMFECDCHYHLGDQQGVADACGRARVILEEQTRASPDNEELHICLGAVYAILGRKDDAIREGELAVALVKHDAFSVSKAMIELARIHAFLGNHDEAIDQIEYLLSIPSRLNVGFLREHPCWDPLRDHPRFHALLEKYDTN
jgi:TolB-like protein/Flp pilus assembly protein TadD/predicted Ser/Thr protein kinase